MFVFLAGAFAATIVLIVVHGPTGAEVQVNVAEISSIRQPAALPEGHFAKDIQCVIVMNNNRLISTREDCLTIVKKIAAIDGDQPKKEEDDK